MNEASMELSKLIGQQTEKKRKAVEDLKRKVDRSAFDIEKQELYQEMLETADEDRLAWEKAWELFQKT